MVPVADDVETKDVSYVFQEAYVCIAVCGEACQKISSGS